jgi:copper chaperone CopZ
MKTPLLKILIILATVFCSCNTKNSTIEKSFKVWGNCEQSKDRIETAAKVKGVSSAEWNIDSKLLTFKLDTALTSINEVLKSVAKAGHDNELFYADDYAYSKLPEACQYERRSE